MPDPSSPFQDIGFQTIPPHIQKDVLGSANLAFRIAKISLFILLFMFVIEIAIGVVEALLGRTIFIVMFSGVGAENPIIRLFAQHLIHLCLIFISIIATVVGYKLTTASGARVDVVIPAQDYPLLAPLVAEGKAEAIDQYVRLSSLSGFTGTFTQLGLTGLPLATIFMTLFFTLLTLVQADPFTDLTKLTLGAFLGSFVQRQVEQRGSNRSTDQNKSPAGT